VKSFPFNIRPEAPAGVGRSLSAVFHLKVAVGFNGDLGEEEDVANVASVTGAPAAPPVPPTIIMASKGKRASESDRHTEIPDPNPDPSATAPTPTGPRRITGQRARQPNEPKLENGPDPRAKDPTYSTDRTPTSATPPQSPQRALCTRPPKDCSSTNSTSPNRETPQSTWPKLMEAGPTTATQSKNTGTRTATSHSIT
jgi:hypothetical protein